MYLGLVALFTSVLIYMIAHYTDKFDRYMKYRLNEEEKE
jgi:hypothetical protein